MSTSTFTTAYTRTHTATYLSDVVLGAIGDILAHLGIDLIRYHSTFGTSEAAITKWIEEESLDTVVLECTAPTGTSVLIVEFPITYRSSGQADASFVESRAALARYRAKLRRAPDGSTYRLVCTYRTARTPMPGWSATSRASTAGLDSYTFGTLAGAPHATASTRLYMQS